MLNLVQELAKVSYLYTVRYVRLIKVISWRQVLVIFDGGLNEVFECNKKNQVSNDQRQNCEPDNKPAAAVSPQMTEEDPR